MHSIYLLSSRLQALTNYTTYTTYTRVLGQFMSLINLYIYLRFHSHPALVRQFLNLTFPLILYTIKDIINKIISIKIFFDTITIRPCPQSKLLAHQFPCVRISCITLLLTDPISNQDYSNALNVVSNGMSSNRIPAATHVGRSVSADSETI